MTFLIIDAIFHLEKSNAIYLALSIVTTANKYFSSDIMSLNI